MATPTIHRKDGKTTSVMVHPFHSACSSGAYTARPVPGLFTSTMRAMVAPRKASRETNRCAVKRGAAVAEEPVCVCGTEACAMVWYLMILTCPLARRHIACSLHPQAANDTHIVAVPHHAFPDGHAVRERIGVRQLNLLQDLPGFGIVLEKRVEVGIGAPEIPALPADSMRAVAGGLESLLDHPGLGVQAEDHARRRHRHPQLAVPDFLSVRAGSQGARAEQLACLVAPHLIRVQVLRRSLFPRLSCWRLRQRAAPRGRVPNHLVDHAGSGRQVPVQGLPGHRVAVHDLAAVGRADPESPRVVSNAAGSVCLGLEGSQHLTIRVAEQESPVALALIDDPKSIFGRLQSVRSRTVRRLESNLDLARAPDRHGTDR